MKKYEMPEIAEMMKVEWDIPETKFEIFVRDGELVAPSWYNVTSFTYYARFEELENLRDADDDEWYAACAELENPDDPRYLAAVKELTEKVNNFLVRCEKIKEAEEAEAPASVSLPVVSCWATEWESDGITPANVVGGAVLELPSGDLVTVILDGDDELLPDLEGFGYHHAYGDYRLRIFAPEYAWELWETSFRGEDAEWADEQCDRIEKLLGVSYLAIYKAVEAAVDFARAQNHALGLAGAEIYPSAWAPYEE